MLSRPVRSAIVVTSSGLGHQPVSGNAAYSAAKAFSSWFAQALHFEVKDKIDVMSWECGEVSTKMRNAPANGTSILTTDQAINGALRDIGKEYMTMGAFRHGFMHSLFLWMPVTARNMMMYKVSIMVYKRKQKEEAEK